MLVPYSSTVNTTRSVNCSYFSVPRTVGTHHGSTEPGCLSVGNLSSSRHECCPAKRKAAGVISSDPRGIWLSAVDTLRNLFLTPTTEMFSFLQQLRDATH